MHQYIDFLFGRIGAFPLCVGAGLMVLVLDILLRGWREGLARVQMNEMFLPALPFCLLFGVAFAGVSDTLFHGGVIAACRNPFGRGVNYFGWLLGCLVFLFVLGRLTGMNVETLLEIFVPACLPAQALGRIGCFLGGCCYGVPVSSSFGVVYPQGSIPFAAYGSTPLAPFQLYEAGWLLVSYAVVLFLVRRGFRAGVSLIAMGVGRFALEFLRGDPRGSLFRGVFLSPAQCLAILLVATGMSLLCFVVRK